MNDAVVDPRSGITAKVKRSRRKRQLSPGEKTGLWISRVFVWIIILVSVIPMWFVVMASLNPTNSYFSASIIPKIVSLDNYRQLFAHTDFLIWVKNSMVTSIAVALLQVLMTATAAYAFSRFRFWGRKYGLMTLLILQMFPNFLAIAAIYGALSQLNMMDSLVSFVLVLLGGNAFNIWLLKNYFDSIPRDLDEAGIIDGANSWQRFYKIMLPLAMPMLVVIFLFNMLSTFNDYIFSGTILQSPSNYTLGVGMFGLISDQFAKNWGMFAAAALLSAVPLTVTFGLLQRYIANGLVAGSVKG